MSFFEEVGVKAVIEDLNKYLEGGKKIEEQDQRIAKASAAVEVASQKLAGTWTKEQQQALTLANAQANLAKATSGAAEEHSKATGILLKAAGAAGVLIGAYANFRVLEEAINKTTELGDQTYRLQQITGLTAEQASSLIFAADKQGVAFDQLNTGLRFFAKNMLTVQEANDGFTGGAKTTKDILESMGIQVLDTSGKLRPLNDILGDTADFFEKDRNSAEKAGLAAQLFSRSGASLVPVLQLGKEGLAEAAAEAQKLHVQLTEKNVQSIHEFILAQRDAKTALAGLEVEIGTALLPTLTKFFDYVIAHQGDIAKIIETAVQIIGIGAKDINDGLAVIKDALSFIPDNKGIIIAAIVAIGAAMVIAFGPESLALAGIIAIVAGLGEIKAIATGNLTNQEKAKVSAQAAKDVATHTPDQIQSQITKLEKDGSKEALIAAQFLKKALDDQTASGKKAADSANSLVKVQATAAQIQEVLKDKIITFEEAEKLGLDAAAAGRAEGLQAIKDAEDEGKRKAFDYASTIAAVSTAMAASVRAGQTLQLDLAKNALKSEQSAASAVFSRPTLEVAQLQLSLDLVKQANDKLRPSIEADQTAHEDAAAQIERAASAEADAAKSAAADVQASFARLSEAIDNQIAELQGSLDRLNKTFEDQDRKIQDAQIAQQRAQEDAQRNAQQNSDQISRKIQDSIDQLQAQRDAAPAGARGDSTRKSIDSEIKDLQDQLKKASQAQSDYTSRLNDYSTQVDRATQDQSIKTARQRQDEQEKIQQAIQDAQKKKDLLDKQAKADQQAADEEQNKKAAAAKEAAQLQKDLADADKRQLKSFENEEKAISNRIQAYTDETQVLKDQILLADRTLLTQENQRQFTHTLTEQISVTSGEVRTLSDKLGLSFIPEINDATTNFQLMNIALGASNTTSIPNFNRALDSTASHFTSLEGSISHFFDHGFAPPGTPSSGGNTGTGGGIIGGGGSLKPKGYDIGGFTPPAPELVMVHPNEVILPMSNVNRSRQILASAPPGFAAAIGGGQQAGVPPISIDVHGTTDRQQLEQLTIMTTRRAFAEAESTARQSGSVLSNSLG